MSTWTNQSKTASTWANLTKAVSTWVNEIRHAALGFLLKEDGDYLLLETGDKIILDQVGTWSNQTKN